MQQLIEASYFKDYEILEDASGGKPLIVRGIFGRADALNENRRIYPRKVWEKVLSDGSDTMDRIRRRNFFGEVDHPDDGRTLLQRVSHLVTELTLGEDGVVRGVSEIFPTPAGKILEVLFSKKAQVGTSSRGEGDLLKTESGDIVQDNFSLQAFDFVHNPSTAGAYPRPVFEHISRRTGDKLMDLLNEYKELEQSVLELSNLKIAGVPADLHSIIERQATDTLLRLTKIVESAGDMKPLFMGLLTELQTARKPFVHLGRVAENDGGNVHMGLVGKLLAANNTAKAGEAGTVEPLPATVSPASIPLIPGADAASVGEATKKNKEGATMAEGATRSATAKLFRSLVREGEEELDKTTAEANGDEQAVLAQETAQKCEARLLKATRRVMEADAAPLLPKSYEPAPVDAEDETIGEADGDGDEDDALLTASMPDPTDDEIQDDENGPPPEIQAKIDAKTESRRRRPSALRRFSEGDDSIDIPAPPMPQEEEEGDPTDDEGKPLPPMESKLVKTMRKLVAENRRMRYEAKVTEAIAAKAIAKLTRRVRATEAAPRPVTIVANGQRIPSNLAGSVIESLVKRIKEGKKQSAAAPVTESADPGSVSEGPFGTPSFAKIGSGISRLNESRTAGRPSAQSILESQAELGARVAARIGRN